MLHQSIPRSPELSCCNGNVGRDLLPHVSAQPSWAGATVVTFLMPQASKIVRRSLGTWYRFSDIQARFGWKSRTTVYRNMTKYGIEPDDWDLSGRPLFKESTVLRFSALG